MKKALLTFVVIYLGFFQNAFSRDKKLIKNEIFALAQSYKGQSDKDGSKTKSFEPLIKELLSLTEYQNLQEKAIRAIGGWKQIWGPYIYNNNKSNLGKLDPDNIYQVISPSGFYTNVGVYKYPGFKIVSLLKGEYNVGIDKINVRFIQNEILLQKIPRGYSYADLAALKEQNKLRLFEFPKNMPPVGIQGFLTEVYDDEELRITYGEQQGVEGKSLYVLRRVNALAY